MRSIFPASRAFIVAHNLLREAQADLECTSLFSTNAGPPKFQRPDAMLSTRSNICQAMPPNPRNPLIINPLLYNNRFAWPEVFQEFSCRSGHRNQRRDCLHARPPGRSWPPPSSDLLSLEPTFAGSGLTLGCAVGKIRIHWYSQTAEQPKASGE